MHSFKSFSKPIIEGTVSIWSGALRRKPQAYADGFIDMWEKGQKMGLVKGQGYVELKKDTDLINTLKKVVADGYIEDELIDALKLGINGKGKWEFDGRTAYLKDVDGNNVNLNKVDKENVNPQSTPSGAEWESIISVGFNMLDLGQKSPIPANYKDYGVGGTEIFDKFWPKYNDVSLKLGKAFRSEGFQAPMTQTGSGSVILSGQWSSWGGKNKTPKTDMATKKRKISLKKKGGSQLMSAQKGESMATFHAAIQLMGTSGKNKKYLEGIVKKINENFHTIVMDGTIGDLQNQKGFAANLSPKELSQKQDEIKRGQEVNEAMSELMQEVFNGRGRGSEAQDFHKSFKEHFVFEAASGLTKFNAGLGTASHLVEFTESGTISKMHPMGKVDGLGDGSWNIHSDIIDMAGVTDFYVSFKTGSKNPYSALRTKAIRVKKEEKEFDVEFPTLRDLVFETLEEDGTILLTEENLQLDEWALVKKAFDKIKRRASKVRGWVQDKAQDAMNWLKKFVTALYEKVKMVLNRLVSLGKKALHAILHFFGLEPKDAKSSGPSIIFHKMA